MPRPIRCTVSIAALRHNLLIAKSHARASGHSGVWAVVKADAYGHSFANALFGFADADGLAMLDFADAVWCREQGWTKPILMLEGGFCPEDLQLAQIHRLNLVVHNQRQVDWILATEGPAFDIHLKFNTGMNRLGFAPSLAAQLVERFNKSGRTGQIVLTTHFANADATSGFDRDQPLVSAQQQLLQFATAASLGLPTSIANSAATITQLGAAAWARPGIMLYGASAFADRSARQYQLQPAMSLDSEIIAIQHLQAGDQVGYGSRFTAPSAMSIGVVACGYADGYPRHAPSGTPVLVAGVRSRLVGRVSMDMLTVDLTGVSAQIGSPVQLWGSSIGIDEVAQAAGTIGYELMCAVANRVARYRLFELLENHPNG
jgi:alanine racemase